MRKVRFDKSIIGRQEYKSIRENSPDILMRWFKNQNKSESFQESMACVRKIEEILRHRQERSIIVVTHGWFLRHLELYFVQIKREEDILFPDLLNVKFIRLGSVKQKYFWCEHSNKCKALLQQNKTPLAHPTEQVAFTFPDTMLAHKNHS